jgi:hypothetical protein
MNFNLFKNDLIVFSRDMIRIKTILLYDHQQSDARKDFSFHLNQIIEL